MSRKLALLILGAPLLMAAGYSAVTLLHSHQSASQGGSLDTAALGSGTLGYARGGTGNTAAPVSGAVAYGTGSALAWSAAPGSTGDCLKGTISGAPTWGACAAGGGYATIQDEGVSLTQRTTLDFAGAGVTCADSGGTKTLCTIPGGSGSPGGATTQLQYNNAGAFGGMARVTTDGNDAIFTDQTTHPAAPSAGFLKGYAFQHHGSTAPAIFQFVDGESQMEQSIFPFKASFDYRWGCLTPAGAGNALLAASGFAPPSGNTTGTAAAVKWAVTDERTRHSWVQFPSATTASSSAGVRANADTMWRGNAANLGGWYWWATMNIVTTTANQRVFMGLKDATAVITATTNPSASLDTVYFGCDAAQTTLRICSNDNTGAATCTDLGANFPCTTANIAYDVALWAAPNGSAIGYYIRRLVGGQTASGSLSTDLPRNTVALGWDLWINNGGTAAASTMQFGGVCYIANP